jgi:hypothetical protein
MRAVMSNLSDDDMTTEPTEAEEDRDQGGRHERDTGDEPTESDRGTSTPAAKDPGHGRRVLTCRRPPPRTLAVG